MKLLKQIQVCICFISLLKVVCECPCLDNKISPNTTAYKLDKKLFEGYDQYIIPLIDYKSVIKVKIDFYLMQVIEIVSGL